MRDKVRVYANGWSFRFLHPADIAREALQRQARDFGSEQARQIMQVLDQMDLDSDEL